jgi:hypothetical protein
MKNPFKTDLPEFFEWIDPEQERKDNKNAKIVGWGILLGGVVLLWGLFTGNFPTAFALFFACLFGSYMLTED